MRVKRYRYDDDSRRARLLEGNASQGDVDALLRKNAYPHLKGWESAEKTVRENKVTGPTLISLVLENAIPYGEFQQLDLYHKIGLFETEIDFEKDSMPMFPQALSPWFGRATAEYLYSGYISASYPVPREPTFLGLGAGGGYLDHDLIEYVTGNKFNPGSEYPRFYHQFRNGSRFIISDRTDRSLGLLHEQLDGLVGERDLEGRVEIKRINALDFQLEKQPFGIVYANEILDNLPIEPIVTDEGREYRVYLIPYTERQSMTEGEYQEKISERFTTLKDRVLTGKEFKSRADEGMTGDVKFLPVLVPLDATPDLKAQVAASQSFRRNIGTEEFGNIYPFQTGVGGVFDSVRRSFDHAILMFVDYASFHGGYHNWNKAINVFRNLRFGEEDLDFQIDFQQTLEEAENRGMESVLLESQKDMLGRMLPMLGTFGVEEIERWKQANGTERFGEEATAKGISILYGMAASQMSAGYKVLALKF